MFPLGSVLLPGMALPLRVFEPRYRTMLDDLGRDNDAEFGVVLIERGSEVGGGDERSTVGCVARIVDMERAADGTARLVAVGTDVIEVASWLPDDPYPRAAVRTVDRRAPQDAHLVELWNTLSDVESDARAIIEMAFEMGLAQQPGLPELAEEPWQRIYHLAMVLPLGPLDRHRVLCAADAPTAANQLAEMAAEQVLMIRARYDARG